MNRFHYSLSHSLFLTHSFTHSLSHTLSLFYSLFPSHSLSHSLFHTQMVECYAMHELSYINQIPKLPCLHSFTELFPKDFSSLLWTIVHSWSSNGSVLTLKVLNFWKSTSYCSLKPLWSGMGEVVPARTSPTLHPPSPPTVHQLSRLSL